MAELKNQIFYNQVMDKSAIKHLIVRLVACLGRVCTAHILDQLKTLGFQYSTQTGISLGIDDLLASPLKNWILQDAENEANVSQEYCRHGCIHAVERLRQIVETWHTTSEFLKREMTVSFNMLDGFNPVHMMSFSGARGNVSQVHQLVGMRGLISDPQGNIIDLPIQSNLREGLSLTEYIISCYGARKGVVDTAIRTADAGYLTRRLVQVAQHVVIRNIDCNTTEGIVLRSIRTRQGNASLAQESRIIGRVLAKPLFSGERCIAMRNQDIGPDLAVKLAIIYPKPILVRSPITCKTTNWVCQLCYGWGVNQGKMVAIGEAIGVVAGQSIGEPGTQLTLRTFHTGGVFTGDIAHHLRAPFNGIACFETDNCQPTRNRHGRLVWKCLQELTITIIGQGKKHLLIVPSHSLLLINTNQYVESKQVIAEVRASIAPLKEKVQRHIYSYLQGEVVDTRSALRLSSVFNDSILPIHQNTNTGHLWIWSGKMSQLSGKQVSTIYTSEDFVQIDITVANKTYLLHNDKRPKRLVTNSILTGNFLDFKQVNSTQTGTVRSVIIQKPDTLRILVLSSLDLLEIKSYDDIPMFRPSLHLHNYEHIFNFKNNSQFNTMIDVKQVNTASSFAINRIMPKLGLGIKSMASATIRYSSSGLFGKLATSLQFGSLVENYTANSSENVNPIYNWYYINEYTNRHHISQILRMLLPTKFHHYIAFCLSNTQKEVAQFGKLVSKGTILQTNKQLSESGKIISIFKNKIIFRLSQPYLLALGTIIHPDCYDIIDRGDIVITMMYEQLRTTDIIQGLPKAEQLLEARSFNEVVLTLENDFVTLTERIARQLRSLSRSYILSSKESTKHSQIDLVNRIQTVYLSQGVRIVDKHIEIIVRQMSSKVMLVENGDPLAVSSGGLICLPLPPIGSFVPENWIEIPLSYVIDNHTFLPRELIELTRAHKINSVIQNAVAYKPVLLGITKASLNTSSFISEASFQQTSRVLSKSALQGRVDWIQGLQENVLFGKMIPAGTGCKEIFIQFTYSNIFKTKWATQKQSKLFSNRMFHLYVSDLQAYLRVNFKSSVLPSTNQTQQYNFRTQIRTLPFHTIASIAKP
uniref:DNA-directed RNA polymerase n=1 Tax=Zygnema circumcarinatum TaxID=35869 RepID=A0A6N0GXE1_ZYGCR|nr:beta'' subunit of RNA polymerase [Zygnema circumcarinatum]